MSDTSNPTILIVAQDTQGVAKECMEARGFQVIGVEHDGEKAVDSILRQRPDAVMCDAFLPRMDAMGIVEQLRAKGYRGLFFCISNAPNDALAAALMKSGTDYYVIRPFSFDYLAERIRSKLSQTRKTSNLFPLPMQINDEYDLEGCVSELMRQIGVPAHIRGYNYIRKSIIMSLENSDMLNAITKELYPGVARAYNTTPSRVERAIRHAIEVAWTRGDIEALNSMFGYTIKTSKGKPTNGEFISMLTDRLRMTLKIG